MDQHGSFDAAVLIQAVKDVEGNLEGDLKGDLIGPCLERSREISRV